MRTGGKTGWQAGLLSRGLGEGHWPWRQEQARGPEAALSWERTTARKEPGGEGGRMVSNRWGGGGAVNPLRE